MKLFTKITVALGTALCVAALALGAAGLAMGGHLGSFIWENGRLTFHPYTLGSGSAPAGADHLPESSLDGDSYTAQGVTALDLDVDAASVTIQEGDDFRVESENAPGLTAELDGDGVWKIRYKDRVVLVGGHTARILVTLPRGVRLEKAELTLGAGKLEGAGLWASELDCEVGAGSIALTEVTVETSAELQVDAGSLALSGDLSKASVDGRCSMGELTLTTTRPERYGYRVENSMGRVQLDDERFNGMSSSGRRDEDAPVLYGLECSMGTITVTFTG